MPDSKTPHEWGPLETLTDFWPVNGVHPVGHRCKVHEHCTLNVRLPNMTLFGAAGELVLVLRHALMEYRRSGALSQEMQMAMERVLTLAGLGLPPSKPTPTGDDPKP